MIEIKDSSSKRWVSERFAKDVSPLNLRDHLFEDSDPRIRLTTDRWGDDVIIIGYSEPIELPIPLSFGETEICHWIIGLRIRDHCLGYYDPESIDQTEYPPYISQPFVHPDYSSIRGREISHQKFHHKGETKKHHSPQRKH